MKSTGGARDEIKICRMQMPAWSWRSMRAERTNPFDCTAFNNALKVGALGVSN